ncbi:alpha/beta fold hydrolase [Tsukamurella sp. 8F]|uniref:alpha/beta hydrolase n=1 Tax=unclassified Tsukamurella TaxID=2633480 RepID=UPI0023BA2243|nr:MULTISPECIES: alpha/beta hydrolase [unclassified Tsukamurella]MDF0531106.1 alpha/beta fold hydrolase [Tsukamurella sp. 8J]MDF0588352.1 alpha/beta fold hydrolase [Tsukamurella sp. 8F]
MDVYRRYDVDLVVDGTPCAAWLYRPTGGGAYPIVVMAHGLGGQRVFGLEPFAEGFAAAGYAVLLFDYRYFGGSGGQPRQLVDIRRQLDDWRAAIALARVLPDVDADRIALWGTSLSGGHVQVLAAHDRRIGAVIAQVPFVDGLVSAASTPPRQGARLIAAGMRDVIGTRLGRAPHRIRLFGPAGGTAVMSGPGVEEAIRTMMPPGQWDETVPARLVPQLARYRPGRCAGDVTCPMLYLIGDHDDITSPTAAARVARRAPDAELIHYPINHFDIYTDRWRDTAIADQRDFLDRNLPLRYR